jgi:hypothetical protein
VELTRIGWPSAVLLSTENPLSSNQWVMATRTMNEKMKDRTSKLKHLFFNYGVTAVVVRM